MQEPLPYDMTLIYGIDHGIADQLRSLGVTRYHHLAEIDAAGVAGIRNELGVRAQISRHGWIEQAALLDRGHGTAHSWRMIQGDYDALVDYPAHPPRRDPDFAQWLLERASSHASGVLEGEVLAPAAVPELAEEFAVSSDDVAQAAAQGEGGDLVSYSTDAAAADMHVVAVEPDAGARVVFDEDADQSELLPDLVPEAGLVQQAELVSASLHEEGAEPGGAGLEGHARSIVDRITALERDAAELPVMSSRSVVSVPSPASSQPPNVVTLPPALPAADEMAAVPLSRSDEADVRIYMREMHAAGLEPMRERRRENPGASGRDFDKDDYAAYRDRVEEAAVEIITALPDDQAQVSGDQEAGDAGSDRPKAAGQVRRFLKALKGE